MTKRRIRREIQNVLKSAFLPEFLNRIDETIIFHPLGRQRALHADRRHPAWAGWNGSLPRSACRFASRRRAGGLAEEGFEPAFGARPLKRVIQQRLANPLANALLEQKIREGDVVEIDYAGSEFTFNPVRDSAKSTNESERHVTSALSAGDLGQHVHAVCGRRTLPGACCLCRSDFAVLWRRPGSRIPFRVRTDRTGRTSRHVDATVRIELGGSDRRPGSFFTACSWRTRRSGGGGGIFLRDFRRDCRFSA